MMNNTTMTKEPATLTPLFKLGRLAMTPGARDAMIEASQSPAMFLCRHISGDWGDCGPEDAAANDYALGRELRIFSVYHTTAGVKLWLITEADRSASTLLLPSEY